MTLYELVNSTTIQGNIRVSMWEDDEERIISTWENCEELFSGEIEDEWMGLVVD